MIPALLLEPLLASSNVTFFVLFGVFVAAFVVLCVIVLRWAIRRDSAGRAAWRARQLQGQQPPQPSPASQPSQASQASQAAGDTEAPPGPPT